MAYGRQKGGLRYCPPAPCLLVQKLLSGNGFRAWECSKAMTKKAPGPEPDNPDNPDNSRICYCMKVHREELLTAIASGAQSIEALRDATRAGSGCGTCRSELLELLQEALPGQELDSRIW